MPKVVLVIQRFHPYNKVGARRWSKFVDRLQHYPDLQLSVITQNNYIDTGNPWNITINESKTSIHRLPNLLAYLSTLFPFAAGFLTKLDWIKYKIFGHKDEGYGFSKKAFRYLEKHLHQLKPDLIIASSPAYSTCYFASAFKQKHPEIKLINDFRDAWIDGFFSWNTGDPQTHPTYKKQAEMESMALNNCDAVVTVTPELQELLSKKIQNTGTTCKLITNGFDTKDLPSQNTSAPPLLKEGKTQICHFGTLDFGRENEFLKFYSHFTDENDFHFILIGQHHPVLLERLKDASNVTLLENLPADELRKYQLYAEFHLIINDLEFYYAYGSKIYDAFLYRKPVIYVTKPNSLVKLLESSGVMIHTDNSDASNKMIVGRIRKFVPPSTYPDLSAFGMDNIAAQYHDLILHLCKG